MSDVLSFCLITGLIVIPLTVLILFSFVAFLGSYDIQSVIVFGPVG